jgi:hypothetical protein
MTNNIGTITVLCHQVEYNSGNVVIDDSAEETLHDIVYDALVDEETSGSVEMHLEEEGTGRELKVMVSWRVVNLEAEKWKTIAKALYHALDESVQAVDALECAVDAMNKYENAIIEQ